MPKMPPCLFLFSRLIFVIDLDNIRQRLKESLIDRCRNYMSTDWLPQDDAKTIPVQGFYTGTLLEQEG